MKKTNILFLACLVILLSTQISVGQNQSNSIDVNNYYYISNKSLGDELALNYSFEKKDFLIQNRGYYFRFVPYYANQYKIQILINNKFWALSSKPDGYPIFTPVSQSDIYQNWEIELQPDGFYKITNAGLKSKNFPYSSLYSDAQKTLFLLTWNEAKSFNGRWKFTVAGPVNQNDNLDRFDNKRMILTSASTNKNMCLEYFWTSDATGEDYICPCKGNLDRFIFQKTIKGTYFIKVEQNRGGQIKSFYLDHQLQLRRTEEFNIADPDNYNTWRISDLGNNLFMITNAATKMSFEYVKGWNATASDKIELKRGVNKYEQYWILRE